MTRELVFGRNAVREALRGRREVLELWVSERAAASLDWLGEGPRPRVVKERELTEAAESPDHQGVVAWAGPYPYADPWALAAEDRPLLACLDQVTDPRNLGAVIRSAAGAGATGVIVPAHGAVQVTPAVCRSSAGTVEHLPVAVVPNLARYLAEIKRDDLWSYAATADAPQTMWQADLTGGVALVFGAEGKGVRPLVRKTCDATVSIPLAAGVESLNVSVAAAVLLYEARRQRYVGSGRLAEAMRRRQGPQRLAGIHPGARTAPYDGPMPEPTLYLFDGYNLLHAGRHADVRELADELASFVAMNGARGVVVFDGVGEELELGPLSVRYAPHADTLLERLAADHRHGERVCLVSSDAAVRGTSGQEVRKVSSATFLHDLESPRHAEDEASRVRDRIDPETRARLERLRRGL